MCSTTILKQDMQAIDEDITMAREILEQLEKIPSHDFLSRLAWTLYQVPKLKVLASGFDSNTDHIHKIITTFVQTDVLQNTDAMIKKLVKAQKQTERLHKKEVKKLDVFLKSIQEKNTSVVEDAIIDARWQEQEEVERELTVRGKNDKQEVVEGIVKDAKKGGKKEDEIPKPTKVTQKPTTIANSKAFKSKGSPDATIVKLKQEQPLQVIINDVSTSKRPSSGASKQKDEITKTDTASATKKEKVIESVPAVSSIKPRIPSNAKPIAKPKSTKTAEPTSNSLNTSQSKASPERTKQKTEKKTALPKSLAGSPKPRKTASKANSDKDKAMPIAAVSGSPKAVSPKKSPKATVEHKPQRNMLKLASTTGDAKMVKPTGSSGIRNKVKATKPAAKAASTAGDGKALKQKPPLNRSPRSV